MSSSSGARGLKTRSFSMLRADDDPTGTRSRRASFRTALRLPTKQGSHVCVPSVATTSIMRTDPTNGMKPTPTPSPAEHTFAISMRLTSPCWKP